MSGEHRPAAPAGPPSVVLITGSCCIPGLAAVEHQVTRLIEENLAGTDATLHLVSPVGALAGSLPTAVTGRLKAALAAGSMPLPAIVVDGEILASGPACLDTLGTKLAARFGLAAATEAGRDA